MIVLFEMIKTYFSLSKEGRRFFRRMRSQLRKDDLVQIRKAASDPYKRKGFIRTMKVTDRIFSRYVTDDMCRKLKRDKLGMYSRLVSFACCMLEVRRRTLEAFGIMCDNEAEERCVMFAFLHREWDDLRDQADCSVEDLRRGMQEDEAPEEITFLKEIRQALHRSLDRDRFKEYYKHLQDYSYYATLERTEGEGDAFVRKTATYTSLLQTYTMVEEIPDILIEILTPFSMWFYCLDELADLERDKQSGRNTFMGRQKDPVKKIWELYYICEKMVREHASYPERLLDLMKVLMDRVVRARENGEDVEIYGFNLDS